ncbi:MAG: zinc ribbon domain-containing protein [Lentisphaeria bacterium]|nr:zinc ribbon domain-containing protein [Lentisphaeria bacterium]
MNCKKCGANLRDIAKYCHVCGAPQTGGASQTDGALPVITGNEWFSFVNNGNYSLKYKLNTNLEIVCGGRTVGLLAHFHDDTQNNHYYDLVQSENDNNPVVRFVRDDKTLSCVDPVSGKVFFTWNRLSSIASEIFSGSKWNCGNLSLSQNAIRCLIQLVPRISFLVPTKYCVADGGRQAGFVNGSCFSFSNSKTAVVIDRSRVWEILAVAIILSDDELG